MMRSESAMPSTERGRMSVGRFPDMGAAVPDMQDRDRAPAGMAAQMGPSLPGWPLTQTRLSATSLRRSARRCPPARRESREAPGWGEPEFIVRNLWRLYAGWWDGDPARLKPAPAAALAIELADLAGGTGRLAARAEHLRSEEHTSELQSQSNLVCRLLL